MVSTLPRDPSSESRYPWLGPIIAFLGLGFISLGVAGFEIRSACHEQAQQEEAARRNRDFQAQRNALAAPVQALGGRVSWGERPGAFELPGERNCGPTPQSGIGVDLSSRPIVDRDLLCLHNFGSLEELNLDNTNVADTGLPLLWHLKQLKHLGLWETKVTLSGAARLQRELPDCKIHHRIYMTEMEDPQELEFSRQMQELNQPDLREFDLPAVPLPSPWETVGGSENRFRY